MSRLIEIRPKDPRREAAEDALRDFNDWRDNWEASFAEELPARIQEPLDELLHIIAGAAGLTPLEAESFGTYRRSLTQKQESRIERRAWKREMRLLDRHHRSA